MTIEPLGPGTPERLGRYRLLGALEPSASFEPMLAAAPDGSLVVVQQARAELLTEPDFRIRLRHSAVAAMRVSGPSHTTVLDIDADAEKPWLAAAFVPGIRLDRAVEAHGPLPVPAVRALAGSLASALRAVHGAGLVHRRVRADTVLLTRDSGQLGEIGIVAAAAASPHGTATVLGTPEYLAPEQTLGLELTPAADIFALGSVLAFAASGAAPFTAPSVPYILFNIAQREPDLSRVPEPLREMIAACLRKDPGARPTPAQILDYLGGPPSTPAPWPAGVAEDIAREQQQAAALLAALPPVTPPEPSRSFPEVATAMWTIARGWASRRWRSTGTRARRGLAVVGVALVLAVAGTVAFTGGEESRPAPVTGLTLAELRRVDACAWLDDALGPSVPVAPAAVPKEAWKLTPSVSWGCNAVASGYTITLSPGKEEEYLTPLVTEVDGVPIIHGTPNGCTRAIASPGAESDAGIVVDVWRPSNVKDCGAADHVIANIARSLSSAPTARIRDGSLAGLAPCDLIGRDEVASRIGTLPKAPTVADAHTCQWDARVRLTIALLGTSSYTSGASAAPTTVDGIAIYPDGGGASSICIRSYLVPDAEKETIEVEIQGAEGRRDEYCALAVSVLREVVENLPAR
ncbi:serine/threonine-protein kinase [Nocardia neocaledoniensis]|uniref:serine/threonine-protein kinase n=1 Tax=Nocardia neocaledoniensis TaxID=236511 RepID=UPI002453D757|nr:serine/threonine-protein kinase [Nocardia neocaledoniensis]